MYLVTIDLSSPQSAARRSAFFTMGFLIRLTITTVAITIVADLNPYVPNSLLTEFIIPSILYPPDFYSRRPPLMKEILSAEFVVKLVKVRVGKISSINAVVSYFVLRFLCAHGKQFIP